MVYTALAMTYRYFQGAYLPDSPILSTMAPKFIPSFGNDGWEAAFRPQSIVFVSMLSTAFMCHFNSPKVSSNSFKNSLMVKKDSNRFILPYISSTKS